MTLEIKIDNPKYFEDIVTHEILHIFQFAKNGVLSFGFAPFVCSRKKNAPKNRCAAFRFK